MSTETVATYDEALDELVERIRVASFEGPAAASFSEWSRRIKALFEPIGWIGEGEADRPGEWFFHYEDESCDGFRAVRHAFALASPEEETR